LGASRHINEKEIKKIFKGITTLSNKYNFSLIGGDTSRASKLFLDVWAVGVCDKFIKRSTALEGDYIFITGKLGKRKFNQNFTPRLKEAQYLVSNFKINSMIDISDGFIIDLYRILKESNAGAFLYKTAIPLAKPNDLYRGEDYELIFTVSKNEKKIALLKSKFYFVGVVKDRQFGYKIESGSKLYDVNIKGYTHF
jgi:thiamine-monophosphate kinase